MKFLKVKIRDWIKSSRVKSKGSIDIYKEDLRELDETIYKGNGSEAIVNKRIKVINSIQRLDQLHAMDVAQKTKIKGVMVHGLWIENLLKSRRNFYIISGTGCNSSFIALILKVPGANLVKDFRPISLIGSVYKIIAKILANPMVRVLGDIVNEVQSAFIAERKILDCPFILNEVLQWCKSKKKQSLIFKVDFEKTYDSIRRDFLDDVLKKFEFGNKWCNWIQTCLNSSRGSILVNGSPTEEFQFFKGLKQGDPQSPFLFILIMESLHLSFQWVVDAEMFKGLNLSHSMSLSHMFYADDAVFVGQWSEENINTLIHVLVCFHRVSGTKVGGAMSRVQAWKEVVDKVKYRLSKWKMKALSIGDRLTLLKSVLGSIPIFHMSIFRVPSKVLQAMESLRRHFFNGHEIGSHKATRRFFNQKSSLWKNVIKAIHGVDGNVNKGNMFAGRSCWSSIMNEVRLLKGRGANIFDFMKLRLGNGETIKFWTDNWYHGGILRDLCPRLFALENCKDVTVSAKMRDPDLEFSFRRGIGGFEHEEFHVLVEVVKSINMVPMEDRWVWNLENSGEFSVSSIRMKIDELRLPRVSYKTRWVKHVPINVNVFAWKVMVDALLTRFNLSRRGIGIQSISCPICDCGVESMEHLFFRCSLIRQLGRKVSKW
nr:RNA-directed DNA polymerase, eukaryota, reverse transcriptase zinc-binding domain protein [Tanacetum cinerariifolium]